jgi:hypothetical protein
MRYSPYYIFKEYEYYKLARTYTIGSGIGLTSETTLTNGISKSTNIQVKDATSTSYSASAKIGVTSKAANFDLTGNLQHTTSHEVTVTDYSATTTEISRTSRWTKEIDDAQRVFVYKRVLRFELLRADDQYIVKQWEVLVDEDESYLSYPTSTIERDNLKIGSSLVNDVWFKQSSPINRIPLMTGNSQPYGIASSSSAYSTTYLAYNAFDDESNWTC